MSKRATRACQREIVFRRFHPRNALAAVSVRIWIHSVTCVACMRARELPSCRLAVGGAVPPVSFINSVRRQGERDAADLTS